MNNSQDKILRVPFEASSKAFNNICKAIGVILKENYCKENRDLLYDIDWHSFHKIIVRHRLPLYLLKEMLNNFSLSENVKKELKEYIKNKSIESFNQLNEMKIVSEAFKVNNTDILFLKGIVHSALFYNDVIDRQARDIDILIHSNEVKKADSILTSLGYSKIRKEFDLTPKQFNEFIKFEKEIEYYHPGKKIYIDLHWKLNNESDFDVNINDKAIRKNIVFPVDFEVNTMGFDYNLLYLFSHGGVSAWFRLIWLFDVAMALKKYPEYDWDAFISLSHEHGVKRSVLQGLLLVNKFWSIEIPPQINKMIEKDKLIIRNSRIPIKATVHSGVYFKDSMFSKMERRIYLATLKNNWLYVLKTILSFRLTTPYDWMFLKLPDKLFFLYYVLRPYFLFIRIIKRNKFYKTS